MMVLAASGVIAVNVEHCLSVYIDTFNTKGGYRVYAEVPGADGDVLLGTYTTLTVAKNALAMMTNVRMDTAPGLVAES